jgi:hypothetical protein
MKKIVSIVLNTEPEYTTKQVSEITWFSMLTIRKYINIWIIKWYRKWTRNWVVMKKDLNDFLVWQWKPTLDEMAKDQEKFETK